MPEHEHDPDRTEVHTGARAAAETDTIAIPGYRIERRLGEGGMGAVYLAEEIALSRRVAIKVVSDRIARDAEVRARFLREARLLATVEHPNVVRVYTFGSVEDRPYLVMEYVEGETLAERIQRTGPMPIDDALHILREIIDALAGAWEKQVIHRDIKPSNVLFDKRGRLKVADFGLAKGVASSDRESSLTQTGYLLGSPHYVAPEQAQGHDSDFRADIYSLGIVLFEMVTGRKPFEAASALAVVAKHLHDELPSARSMRKDVPDHIETLIRWMTDKDPNRRPRSYEELSAATNATAVGSARPRAAVPTQKRVVFALAAIVIAGWLAWARLSGDKTRIADNADDARIVIAVAPFYGPDPDSAREGRVMASLVARELERRMRDRVKVMGVEDTNVALRDTDAARALGERLGATLVIWGDAYKFRGEAAIEPSLTTVPKKNAVKSQQAPADFFADFNRASVRVATEAPNQVELRKTSAEGIGDLVVLAIATQLLHEQNDADGALALLSQLKPTPDAHHEKAICLLQLGREDAARNELQQALALDPKHAASRATLAGLAMRDHHYRDAAAHLAAAGDASFTSTDGMLYGGKLYAVEQFYNMDRRQRAPTLLAIDPQTERVTARYALPGTPVAFTIDGEDLVIRYDAGMDGAPRIESVRFANGRFDPPRQLPANPYTRMTGARAMWLPVVDFITDVSTPKAMLVRHPVFRYNPLPESPKTGPKTLAELKASLESAMERDPTQPAYPLWLAVTQWELGDRASAEQNARRAFSDAYAEVPYYDYAWLSRQLESFGHREWADLAYAQALRRRKELPDPISSSVLIERLVNAPMTRGAASRSHWAPDPARQFAVMMHSRELSGAVAESDPMVARTWERYFESKDDSASAARARALATSATGVQPARTGAIVDLLFGAIFSVALVLVALLVFVSVSALRAAAWQPMSAAPWIARRDRIAIAALLTIEIILAFAQIRMLRRVDVMSATPIGLADALGSAPVIDALEKQLPSKPELTFATAVANHLAGRTKRARALYAQISGEDVTQNSNDLGENRPPRHVPPSAEVRAMFESVPMSQTFVDAASAWTTRRATFDDEPWEHRILHVSALLGIFAILLLLFCAWIAGTRADDAERPLVTLRVACGIAAAVFAIAMLLASKSGAKQTNGMPTPGPIAAQFQPVYENASPMPPMPTYEAAARWTATHSPQMRMYYASLIAAALLALALLAPVAWRYFAALSRIRRPIWNCSGSSSV